MSMTIANANEFRFLSSSLLQQPINDCVETCVVEPINDFYSLFEFLIVNIILKKLICM